MKTETLVIELTQTHIKKKKEILKKLSLSQIEVEIDSIDRRDTLSLKVSRKAGPY